MTGDWYQQERQFPRTGQEIQEEDGSCLLDTY